MDLFLFLLLCISIPQIKGNESTKIKVDVEHLKSDFLSIFGSWASIFSDAEMDFRYFAAHDYDGNKRLDGLELFIALGHDSPHGNGTEEEHLVPEELERKVDDIFLEHDANNDGFLDYKEFVKLQRNYPD